MADPSHVLVYKVAGKCPDTVRVTRHPSALRITPVSKTRCAVKMGFGELFWKRKEYFLVLQGTSLSLMVGAMHKDHLLDLALSKQYVVSPYGAYKVVVKENAPLFGKWKTYTAEFRPEGSPTFALILKFGTQIGILSLENKDESGAKIGAIDLYSVDGKPLEQFVKDSAME